NRHPETGKSIVDYYREGGIPWGFIQPVHGQGSRQTRAATLHEYLKPYVDENTGLVTARLKIFSTCTLLVETLPQLVSDPNRPEQVRECSIDHYYDALTYGLCAWHAERSKEPPKPKTLIQLDKERLSRRNRDFMKRALMM
ncbi:hypothetical protein, partial [Desulfofundulus sp.]|uniref:hypothetical protein n=1 Tax=Desulfofundulus sp. TaxID=2282750 RepID=UPI003C7159D9